MPNNFFHAFERFMFNNYRDDSVFYLVRFKRQRDKKKMNWSYIHVISTFDNSEKLHPPNIWRNIVEYSTPRRIEEAPALAAGKSLCVTHLSLMQTKINQSEVASYFALFPRSVPVCSEAKRDMAPGHLSPGVHWRCHWKTLIVRSEFRCCNDVINR